MTCAKRSVVCYLFTRDGAIAGSGSNACLSPQQECPRAPGEGYEKCRSICQQAGHAETVALKVARENGRSLGGGLALIIGHDRICEDCWAALSAAGISEVEFR